MFPYRETSASRNKANNDRNQTYSIKQSPYRKPPNYMVVNFPNEYIDYEDEEGYVARSATSVEKKDKAAITLLKKKIIANPPPTSLPSLSSSFALPKVQSLKPEPVVRNMMGRSDVACQAGPDLTRAQFDGLQEFQDWTVDKVEPFMKHLKKALKTQRPANLTDYVVAYCLALADGAPEPVTIDEEEEERMREVEKVPASEN